MNYDETVKHGGALDIAAAEGFEWDYEDADPDDLYESIEVMGYWYDEDAGNWLGPENPRNPMSFPTP